jgi:hypothetical protein
MKYAFYVIYNVIYQIFSFWLLLLVGTYYNEVVISACLFWESPKESADLSRSEPIKALALIIEAAILLLMIYGVNQSILSDTEIKARRVSIANRTAIINIVVTLIFLCLMIFSN